MMRAPSRQILVVCGHCQARTKKRVNGEWLRWKRLKAKVGLREFGRVNNQKHSTLSEIETNKRACPPRLLAAYEALRTKR